MRLSPSLLICPIGALLKTTTSSTFVIGLFLACCQPLGLLLIQYQQYLKSLKLLSISLVVNGWLAVSTIAPLSFITRSYSAHNGSNGMIVSHLQAVVPYGKSHNIISIEPSGISFIISKQSPWCILFNSS